MSLFNLDEQQRLIGLDRLNGSTQHFCLVPFNINFNEVHILESKIIESLHRHLVFNRIWQGPETRERGQSSSCFILWDMQGQGSTFIRQTHVEYFYLRMIPGSQHVAKRRLWLECFDGLRKARKIIGIHSIICTNIYG